MDEDANKVQSSPANAHSGDDESLLLAKQRLFRDAAVLTNFIELMGRLAAPCVLRAMTAEEMTALTPARLLSIADSYLAVIDAVKTNHFHDGDGRLAGTEQAARQARVLLATWSVAHEAPQELVQTAREYFRAANLGEPDEGWDSWTGLRAG